MTFLSRLFFPYVFFLHFFLWLLSISLLALYHQDKYSMSCCKGSIESEWWNQSIERTELTAVVNQWLLFSISGRAGRWEGSASHNNNNSNNNSDNNSNNIDWRIYFDGERRLSLATRRAAKLFGQTTTICRRRHRCPRRRRYRRRRRRRRRRWCVWLGRRRCCCRQKSCVPVEASHFQAGSTTATAGATAANYKITKTKDISHSSISTFLNPLMAVDPTIQHISIQLFRVSINTHLKHVSLSYFNIYQFSFIYCCWILPLKA